MSNFLIAVFAFILAIGILVTFHEFGHFWVARRFGVKVLRFSVGFGKPLFTWRDKQQTEYVIAALPLGGYVRMLDEREGPVPEDQKSFSFNRQSVWARFTIVLAGPLFNFLFAVIVYWLTFMHGVSGWVPLIGEIKSESIAMQAGMVANEEVLSIDHVPTNTWQQVMKQLMTRLGDKGLLELETKQADGARRTYLLNLNAWELKGNKPDLLHAIGIEPYQPPIPPIIVEVVRGEPAQIAGVLAGDLITEVNGKPINTWKEFTNVVVNSIDMPVHLLIKRNNETKSITFLPRAKETDNGEVIGFAGLMVKSDPLPAHLIRKEKLNPLAALIAAVNKTKDYIFISFKIIGKMLIGDIGLHNLSGPITMAQGAGATASVGFQYYLGFLALISISLGVLNLLPIPILDGGHLLYFLIEIISGKPVSERIQQYGFKIGMLLLTFLMGIAFYNDILRLF